MSNKKPIVKKAEDQESMYFTEEDIKALKSCVSDTVRQNANDRKLIVWLANWEESLLNKMGQLNLAAMQYEKLKAKGVKK